MKYLAMIIAVALAFFAGMQVSNAKSLNVHALISQPAHSGLVDSMASEWLVPDSANRMMAYHKALHH